MDKLTAPLLLLLLAFLLAACGNQSISVFGNAAATPPSLPPVIVGTITEFDDRMLVEQQPGTTIGDKIFFQYGGSTDIFQRVGDEVHPGSTKDLVVGQRVEVWAGEILT